MSALLKPTSYHKGAALAVAATFVWKLLSFVNALLIAALFGASYKTDIYFYAIMVVGFGVAFMQRLNATVLIPEAIFLNEKDETSATHFLTNWFFVYLVLGGLLAALGLFCPVQMGQLVSRFDSAALRAQHILVSAVFILFALQLLTYYLQAVAEMYRFFKTAWLGVLNALLPLICLLIYGRQLGLVSMVYGLIAANVLQLVVYLLMCKRILKWDFYPHSITFSTRMRQNALSGQTLAVLDIVNSLLPIYLMSGLQAGLISALNYCRQLTDTPTEIFTARVSNISKLQLASDHAQHKPENFNQHFLKTNHFLLVFLVPLVVFSCYFAPQIVEIFFERGSFNALDAKNTVLFLRPMLITLLLLSLGYMQNSVISATRTIKESFIYALSSGLFMTVSFAFGITYWGAFSYPYLLSAGLLVGFGFNYFLFKKHIPFVSYLAHLKAAVRLSFLGAVALLVPALTARILPPDAWTQILICGILFVGIYGVLLYISGDVEKLKNLLKQPGNGF